MVDGKIVESGGPKLVGTTADGAALPVDRLPGDNGGLPKFGLAADTGVAVALAHVAVLGCELMDGGPEIHSDPAAATRSLSMVGPVPA